MVKLISLKCPQCNADISIEENRKRCFCSYCGAQILIDDGSTEHTYRKIDEARIKEAEINAEIRLKEMELKEKERLSKERNNIFKTKLSIILGVIGVIFLLSGLFINKFSFTKDIPVEYTTVIGVMFLVAIGIVWVDGI